MSGELDVLKPMLERIIREEVQQGLKSQGTRHRFTEILVDPESGRLSCSRLGMFLVVAVLFPASLALQALGFDLGAAWSSFVALAGTLAGIYGLNSAARVWRNGGHRPEEPGGE
jgi:hypothetical protein